LNTTPLSTRPWILGCLAALFILAIGLSLWNLASTTPFGESDFKIYWSAAYLLGRGQNPYDIESVKSVQIAETGSLSNEQIIAWNPPFLFVALLPLVWLPFLTAKFAWLVINILLIVTAAFMLIKIYLETAAPRLKLAFIILAVGFPAAITGLYMGQVTFLVFWGLVASLMLIKREQWFWAGAVLILTTVKPHMVVLPVLYILVSMAYRHKYQGWVGLAVAGLAFLAVLLLFRSDILLKLVGETSVASGRWATTTLGGLLSYLGITEAARFLILLFLPLPFFLARSPEKFSLEFSVALLTLITVPTTVFGWSYDQTILLIPIAQVFSWLGRSKFKLAIIAGIVTVTALHYYQRVLPINEVFYVWIPLAWWLIFGITWYGEPRRKKSYA
jgi:hypothetical protein